jgi:hypothetical protein
VSIVEATPDLTFLTNDHPEAGNRTPVLGDKEYSIFFTTDHQKVICIKMGIKGYRAFQGIVKQMSVDVEIEEALKRMQPPIERDIA